MYMEEGANLVCSCAHNVKTAPQSHPVGFAPTDFFANTLTHFSFLLSRRATLLRRLQLLFSFLRTVWDVASMLYIYSYSPTPSSWLKETHAPLIYGERKMEHTAKKSPLCACLYKVSDFEFASQLLLLNACLTLIPNESKETSVSSTE